MRLVIHRGSHEVGGNCIEVYSGHERIVIDVGQPLFDANRNPIDGFAFRRFSKAELSQLGYLPRIEGLFDDCQCSPLAILLSHAHLDHTGLIEHAQPRIPVFASRGTSKMMLAGKLFAGQVLPARDCFVELLPEVTTTIGPFQVTGLSVDHSIYGCMAFLVEANGKRLLYSGDLRTHGRKPGMQRKLVDFLKTRSIDLMLMEGTHLSFPDGNQQTEYQLEASIAEAIGSTVGLVLASFSPLNVDRLVGFIRATIKNGRHFVVDPYTAFVLHLLSNETSLPSLQSPTVIRLLATTDFDHKKLSRINAFRKLATDAFVSLDELLQAGEKYVAMFRPSMCSRLIDEIPPQSTCIYSRWTGYLRNDDWQSIANRLNDRSSHIVELHTSGHIFAAKIREIVELLAPKAVAPIHTFDAARFLEMFDNAILLRDGQVFDL